MIHFIDDDVIIVRRSFRGVELAQNVVNSSCLHYLGVDTVFCREIPIFIIWFTALLVFSGVGG